MTEKEHGGFRPGAGRKPIADASMTAVLQVRVTPEQKLKVTMLGGGDWVRKMIDRAKLPANGGEK